MRTYLVWDGPAPKRRLRTAGQQDGTKRHPAALTGRLQSSL